MKNTGKFFLITAILFLITAVSIFAADLNPVNPNANAETKCLYNYMLSIYKTKTLAGQDTVEDSNWLAGTDITGRYPAIAGFDMTYYSSWPIANGANPNDVDKAIAWHNAGGIVQFQWHWYAPADNIGCWYKAFYTAGSSSADCGGTNFDVSAAVNNPGSAKYNLLVADIDRIAVQLKRLEDAGVPVLWRPLHEAEGGWFWWGAKGADACKKLYYLMYDRLTNYHHLNNLIWVWTINCCSTNLSGNAQYWYPGNDKVDINGVDLYLGAKDYTTADGLFNQVEAASNYRKMAAITEGGNVPNAGSKWIWFSTWNGTSFIRNFNQNELWHTKSVFNDAQVITRDELNIACGPTATPTNTPTPYPIQGKIEVENYKAGADGVAYHDTDAVNVKGAYRNDGVDIEACTDAGGGYSVAQIEATEWMAYNVNVLSSGTYNMTVRVANLGAGGTFHITFNGVTKGGILTLPDTGGWQTWQDLTVPVALTAGVQEMRIVVDTVNAAGLLGNLNYVNFAAASIVTSTPTHTPGLPTSTSTFTPYVSPTFTATECSGCGTCMIEDAADCDATNNWGGAWYVYDDKGPSHGGSSTVWPVDRNFVMSQPGQAGAGDCAVRITGYVTTQYAYGFIGIGTHLKADSSSVNFTNVTGIRFWVKGDGKIYQMKMMNGGSVDVGWNYYRMVFAAPADWTMIQLPFASFTQDPGWGNPVALADVLKDVKGFELQTVGQPHASIDIWIDGLQLYGATGFTCPVAPATSTATRTNTAVPPTWTNTSTATRTNTVAPPTSTATSTSTAVPPTWTNTSTATRTNTAVPPTSTATGTDTAVPPTWTNTSTATRTSTAVPPTSTHTSTIAVPSATFTGTAVISTSTHTATQTATLPAATSTYTSTLMPTSTQTDTAVIFTTTNTPVPPTATRTNTDVPPTSTRTNTAVPPTATGTNTPSPVNTNTATASSTSTAIPPTATATATIRLSFAVTARNLELGNNTNSPKPQFRVTNNGTGPLNLNSIELKYWFNCDCSGQGVQAWLDWAGRLPQGVNVMNSVQVSVVSRVQGTQTHYISVRFTNNLTINPGEYVEVQARFNKTDWSAMQQTNDWSYTSSQSFVSQETVTAYMNGTLVWGKEPYMQVSGLTATVASVLSYPNPSKSGQDTYLQYEIAGSGFNAQDSGSVLYSVPDPDAKVTLSVFTSVGRLIWRTELTGVSNVSSGKHSVKWDGRAAGGRELAAGTYILKVSVDSRSDRDSKSFVLLILK